MPSPQRLKCQRLDQRRGDLRLPPTGAKSGAPVYMGLLDTHWLEKKYINFTNSYSLKKLAEQKEIFMEQNTKQFISFKGSILNGFKKTFDFTGLATRSEFWFWILFGLEVCQSRQR